MPGMRQARTRLLTGRATTPFAFTVSNSVVASMGRLSAPNGAVLGVGCVARSCAGMLVDVLWAQCSFQWPFQSKKLGFRVFVAGARHSSETRLASQHT